MLPLLIRLVHLETGIEREAGFRRSPVRIGRNHLNDLTIDEGFVSQWHGIVRFEEDETRYLDVGSKNGTQYEGKQLESKEEVVLGENAELEIGPIKLTLVRTELRDDQVVSRRASSFRLGGAGGAATDGKAATILLSARASGPMAAPAAVKATGAPAPAPVGDSGAATMVDPGSAGGAATKDANTQMREMLERLEPLHKAYDAARSELEKAMDQSLKELQGRKDGAILLEELRRQAPLAFEIPGMRERAGLPPENDEVNVASWLERLVPVGSNAQWGSAADAMERAGALLEAFAMGLVQLRAAQREVMSRLAVSQSSEGSSLHRIEDPRELLAYLLDPRTQGEQQLDEVARAFADVALHQIGMLNGAIEGARAVLWEISPHQIGAAHAGALARTSPGFGDWLWPFSTVGHYYKYAAKHFELGSGDRFTTYLFGTAFSRAYGRVAGAQGARNSSPSGKIST
ncbi:MAG: FHA domain-containing protein [Sandaracinaceae bacterium]|nr:FHA domain-containing protein [Sandaracinaceae bacterium]